MTKLQKFTLPYMDEMIVGFEGRRGSAIALMHWTDGSNPTLPGPAHQDRALRPRSPGRRRRHPRRGSRITLRPPPIPELGDAVVGLAKDPDGYVIELLQR